VLVDTSPGVPAYRGHLGRALLGLSRTEADPGRKAELAARAANVLRDAVQRSPDDAANRRSLVEATAG
jgi:hypothetical protein